MVLVLFEVMVKKEGRNEYLSLAEGLKDALIQADGFIRSERFSSLAHEGKLLSLSIWENEQAVDTWRNAMHHRMSQRQGRACLFENYTITVTSKIRSYTETDRAEAPGDSKKIFAPVPAI